MKIYWKDIEDSKRQWCGMAVEVSGAPKPKYHLQTGENCRIKLVNCNNTLFWATQIKDFGGVWLIKSFVDIAVDEMPIQPIQSVDIEERKNLQNTEWLKSWCRFFIKQLEQSNVGIFYDGLWLLGPCLSDANQKDWESKSSLTRYMGVAAVYQVKDALLPDNIELISWWLNGCGKLINLKKPDATSGRVKWWRKKVREGRLPPILVWYLNCLDAYIIIDGHDRLMASILENKPPELIAISSAQEFTYPVDQTAQAHILDAFANPKSDRKKSISIEHMNQVLLQAFDNSPVTQATTFSWASIESDQIWVNEVTEFLNKINRDDVLVDIVNRED